MLQFIKSFFNKEEDNNLTEIRRLFNHNWRQFNDVEQNIILLRLSGFSKQDMLDLLNLSPNKLEQTEKQIIERLKQ
jgi:hypothetical protein